MDKWLWYARFFKDRQAIAKLIARKKVRINGQHVSKAHRAVRPGDVLVFPQGKHIRLVRVLAAGTRRGPASEAQLLYQDLEVGTGLE